MNLREVTIGRSRDCDIYLDTRCQFASNHHATLYYDGNQLMYRDTSSNGTMINNINVHKRAVPIRRGDVIMVAGQYPINWNQIDRFFPPNQQPMPAPQQPVVVKQPEPVVPADPDVSEFNWGAFGLYPIWGLFNGCWWAILVSFFFGWLWPLPNIIFGVTGSRTAWDNGNWKSAEDFERTQESWKPWGILFFVVGMIFWICYWAAVFGY